MDIRLINTPDGGATWTYRIPEYVTVGDLRMQTAPLIAAEDWQPLAIGGVYREWTESGNASLGYESHVIEPNPEPDDDIDVASRYMSGTAQQRDIAYREQLQQEIDAQVPVFTSADLMRDPTLEYVFTRSDTQRTLKRLEVQEAADPDTVDITVLPNPDANPDEDTRLTLEIANLEPWVGAPDNDVGFIATLTISQTGDPATGSEARLFLDVAPSDQGGVLGPFTQDLADPYTWRLEARDGHKWSDPDLPVAASLYWGAGSLLVTDRLSVQGLYDRDARLCNYGEVPTP